MKRALVPQFHGTNCDVETLEWLGDNLEVEAEFFSLEKHAGISASEVACIVVPGGFSYGDYLRAGALAARSEKMRAIAKLARSTSSPASPEMGVPTLGICNGFQILCEAGLLPGVLLRNVNRQHNHFPVELSVDFEGVEKTAPVWLPSLKGSSAAGFRKVYERFALPMSCGMGRYWPDTRQAGEHTANPAANPAAERTPLLPLFRYVHNENGAFEAIAGIASADGRIVGLMPHPERASDSKLGGTQGLFLLLGLAENTGLGIRKGSALATFAQTLRNAESTLQKEGGRP
jgi:phosphoribosylformylglycinamidine synthase